MAVISPGHRVAVVTGSNQGIGYFIALQLAMSGKFQDIVLACRNPSRGMEAISRMKKHLAKSPASQVQLSCHPLTLGDVESHSDFTDKMKEIFGKVDCLVNNAATAYKNVDPTPWKDQCKPTLDVNFRGTVDFTEQMLPLIRKGTDPRIVNLSSSAAKLSQVSAPLQEKFASPDLTMDELHTLVNQFESDVASGDHVEKGWSNTHYGMSKLAITAATKIMARDETQYGVKVMCCDPGNCPTTLSSHRGTTPPEEGAKNAVMLAIMEDPPNGAFFQDLKVAKW